MPGTAMARSAPVQNPPVETALPAVITRDESPIVKFLAEQRAAVEPMLPQGVNFLRVVYDVQAALAKDAQQKKPALVNCSPASVFIAVVKIQSWGLEIGQTAHLVPFGRHCEALRDYKGEIQLAKDAGAIFDAWAHCVYENEVKAKQFRYELGMNPILEHIPIFDDKQRGSLVGVYAVVEIRPGHRRPLYMTLEEVNKIRQDHSQQWKSGPMPPWYMKKSVLRQALKHVPKNTRVRAMLARIEEETAPLAGEAALAGALGAGPELVQTAEGDLIDTSTGVIVEEATDAAAEPRMTLEQAMAFPLPWRNSDQHGKPIGEFSTDHLESIAAWCEKRIDDESRPVPQSTLDLYNATQILLEHRGAQAAADESDLPDLSQPPIAELGLGLEAEPERPAPGSTSMRMPTPGLVADALPKRDPVRAPSEVGREIPQVKLPF